MPPPVRYDENGNPIAAPPQQQAAIRYDENGNPVATPPRRAPARSNRRVGDGADVALSARDGLRRGVAFSVGAPTDLANLWEDGVDWLANAATSALNLDLSPDVSPQERARLDRDMAAARARAAADEASGTTGRTGFNLPGSDEIIAADERVFGEHHEPQTTAGRYARTIGEFAPGMIGGPGGLVRRAATTTAAAVGSEAAGRATEGTAFEVPARIAGAIAGHTITNNVGNVATRFNRTPDERAVRMIDRGLRDAGMTPQDLSRNAAALRRQGGEMVETVAEVSGRQGARNQPLQRMARAVTNVRGPGQQIAEDTLNARGEGVTQRVLREATRTAGPRQTRAPRNYYDARESLRTARSGQARQNYRTAYAAPVDEAIYASEIAPLMTGGPVQQSAAKRALEIAQAEVLRTQSQMSLARMAQPQINQLQQRITNLNRAIQGSPRNKGLQQQLREAREDMNQLRALADDAGNLAEDLAQTQRAAADLELLAGGQATNAPNPRVMDFFQRGLRQMSDAEPRGSQLGTAYSTAREAFTQAADRAAPALGEARSLYGQSQRIEELMAEGRRVFNMPEGEIDMLMRGNNGRGMGMEEFDGFMLGVLDAIETKVRGGDTAFVARFMRNENWQRQLERALGRQGARRLRTRIAREANMRRFDNSMRSGSQTTPMAEDIRSLTKGEDELGLLAEVIQAGGNVRGPMLRAAANAYERISQPGIYNPRVNEALATRLYGTATPANLARLEAEIAALQARSRLNMGNTGQIGAIGAVTALGDEETP